jgi:hypothetical protein
VTIRGARFAARLSASPERPTVAAASGRHCSVASVKPRLAGAIV